MGAVDAALGVDAVVAAGERLARLAEGAVRRSARSRCTRRSARSRCAARAPGRAAPELGLELGAARRGLGARRGTRSGVPQEGAFIARRGAWKGSRRGRSRGGGGARRPRGSRAPRRTARCGGGATRARRGASAARRRGCVREHVDGAADVLLVRVLEELEVHVLLLGEGEAGLEEVVGRLGDLGAPLGDAGACRGASAARAVRGSDCGGGGEHDAAAGLRRCRPRRARSPASPASLPLGLALRARRAPRARRGAAWPSADPRRCRRGAGDAAGAAAAAGEGVELGVVPDLGRVLANTPHTTTVLAAFRSRGRAARDVRVHGPAWSPAGVRVGCVGSWGAGASVRARGAVSCSLRDFGRPLRRRSRGHPARSSTIGAARGRTKLGRRPGLRAQPWRPESRRPGPRPPPSVRRLRERAPPPSGPSGPARELARRPGGGPSTGAGEEAFVMQSRRNGAFKRSVMSRSGGAGGRRGARRSCRRRGDGRQDGGPTRREGVDGPAREEGARAPEAEAKHAKTGREGRAGERPKGKTASRAASRQEGGQEGGHGRRRGPASGTPIAIDRGGLEGQSLPLLDCHDRPLEAAQVALSVLARPWGAQKPVHRGRRGAPPGGRDARAPEAPRPRRPARPASASSTRGSSRASTRSPTASPAGPSRS